MPSPILKRVWITNKRDAPSWAGIFSQSSKKSPNSKTTERGIKAMEVLLECGLLQQCNFFPKNSGLWKVSPNEISRSESLQVALHEHIGINLNEYEQLYADWRYPTDLTTLSSLLIDHITDDPDLYACYYHNYSPDKYSELRSRIEKLEQRGVIEPIHSYSTIRWRCASGYNRIDHDPNANSSSYVMNQIETRHLEEISSTEHGLKRKLTTLVNVTN